MGCTPMALKVLYFTSGGLGDWGDGAQLRPRGFRGNRAPMKYLAPLLGEGWFQTRKRVWMKFSTHTGDSLSFQTRWGPDTSWLNLAIWLRVGHVFLFLLPSFPPSFPPFLPLSLPSSSSPSIPPFPLPSLCLSVPVPLSL